MNAHTTLDHTTLAMNVTIVDHLPDTTTGGLVGMMTGVMMIAGTMTGAMMTAVTRIAVMTSAGMRIVVIRR